MTLIERKVQKELINCAKSVVLDVARYTDDLCQGSVFICPQQLTERLLVRPQSPRSRLAYHNDRRPRAPLLLGKPAPAHNRNPDRVEVVRSDSIATAFQGLGRRILSFQGDRYSAVSAGRNVDRPAHPLDAGQSL